MCYCAEIFQSETFNVCISYTEVLLKVLMKVDLTGINIWYYERLNYQHSKVGRVDFSSFCNFLLGWIFVEMVGLFVLFFALISVCIRTSGGVHGIQNI